MHATQLFLHSAPIRMRPPWPRLNPRPRAQQRYAIATESKLSRMLICLMSGGTTSAWRRRTFFALAPWMFPHFCGPLPPSVIVKFCALPGYNFRPGGPIFNTVRDCFHSRLPRRLARPCLITPSVPRHGFQLDDDSSYHGYELRPCLSASA